MSRLSIPVIVGTYLIRELGVLWAVETYSGGVTDSQWYVTTSMTPRPRYPEILPSDANIVREYVFLMTPDDQLLASNDRLTTIPATVPKLPPDKMPDNNWRFGEVVEPWMSTIPTGMELHRHYVWRAHRILPSTVRKGDVVPKPWVADLIMFPGEDKKDYTFDRTIVVAQSSGVTYPKWGLDYYTVRLWSMCDDRQVPSLTSGDMMEQLKNVISSMPEYQVWVPRYMPLISFDNFMDISGADFLPFSFGTLGEKPYGNIVTFLREGCKLTLSSESPPADLPGTPFTPLPPTNPYIHIMNWCGSVVLGNSVRQTPLGNPQSRTSYTSFVIDFQMYTELVDPVDPASRGDASLQNLREHLGNRTPIVDARRHIS